MPRQKTFIIISGHSLERARERMPNLKEHSDTHVKRVLLGMLEDAVPFGGQIGKQRSYLATCKSNGQELVLILADLPDGRQLLRTVLTPDQAQANMQMVMPSHRWGKARR